MGPRGGHKKQYMALAEHLSWAQSCTDNVCVTNWTSALPVLRRKLTVMHSAGVTLNTVDHSLLSQLSFLAHPEPL